MAQARYGSSITRGRRVDEPGVIVKADERKPTKRELQGAGMMLGGSLVSAGGLAAYNEGEDRAIRSWSANRNADWEKRSYDRMRNRARAAHDAGDRRTAGNLLLSAEDHHGDMMREYRSKAERLGRSGRNFKRGGLATAGAGLGLAVAGAYRGNTAGRKKKPDKKPVHKGQFVPTSVLSRTQPMAARVATTTPGVAKPGVNAMSTVASSGGAAGKAAPLAGKATPGSAMTTANSMGAQKPQAAAASMGTMGSMKVQKANGYNREAYAAGVKLPGIMLRTISRGDNALPPAQKAAMIAGIATPYAGTGLVGYQAGKRKHRRPAKVKKDSPRTRTSRRSYDPEDARQRRLGAATATTGIGGALLAREGVRDARRLKAGATGNQFGVGQKLEHAVILDRKAGAKLGGGLAGLATAAQLNAYAHSRRGRRYT